jgi:hypothetical protein
MQEGVLPPEDKFVRQDHFDGLQHTEHIDMVELRKPVPHGADARDEADVLEEILQAVDLTNVERFAVTRSFQGYSLAEMERGINEYLGCIPRGWSRWCLQNALKKAEEKMGPYLRPEMEEI